jgi:hypothetical protein
VNELALNKNNTGNSVEEMKSDLKEEVKEQAGKKTSKPRKDIGAGNPLLRLRYAIKPTPEEIASRSPRDRRKPYLLQRELAARIPCCTTTVRLAEKSSRFPIQRIVFESTQELYRQYFPPETPPARSKAFMSTPSARKHLASKRTPSGRKK